MQKVQATDNKADGLAAHSTTDTAEIPTDGTPTKKRRVMTFDDLHDDADDDQGRP